MNQPLIQVKELTIGYRTLGGDIVDVLRKVSLDIQRGESIGVVGESGCGKTTLGLAMMGYLRFGSRVQEGTVYFDGIDMFNVPGSELEELRGGRVSIIPQSASQALTPSLRAGAQVTEAMVLHQKISKREARERTVELLAQVRLPEPELIARRYPHELSGGQQQRVAIAMALAGNPEMIVLDEPTTGLDVTTQAHIFELLGEIQKETGTAMMFVSHDLGVIARVCDRVAVMYAGEIAEDTAANKIFAQPTHPYARALLASIPRLTQRGLPQTLDGQPPSPGEVISGCSFAPRCSYADETCVTTPPLLEPTGFDIETPHFVRCHHWRRVVETEWSQEMHVRPTAGDGAGTKRSLEMADLDITYFKVRFFEYLQMLRGMKEPPRTVSGINLSIEQGETLALVGESGSGKTTLARTIAGLLQPKEGSLTFGEYDLRPGIGRRPHELRQAVQLIFQNPDASLNPRHTVEQILDSPLRLYFKLNKSQRLERSAEILNRVRLGPQFLQRFPGQMSGGEKQRVAVARAFAAEPTLVLCDEVTSSLDVSVQAAVLQLLAELQADQGVTYLYISHDLAVVRAIADRVAVLYQGRLCEVGSADAIYAPPYHPYTETLLAAVPEPIPGLRPLLLATDVPELAPPPTGCPFQRRCPRRVGTICDEVTPPLQIPADGHMIACHIPLEDLRSTQTSMVGVPVGQVSGNGDGQASG